MTSLILVASSSGARFYTCENLRTKDLTLLESIDHPEGRQKGSDLVSDGPGKSQLDGGRHSSYETTDPKEIEAESFAAKLTHRLKNLCATNLYKKFVIIASPHFYGLIHRHTRNISHNYDFSHIAKDYTKYSPKELLETIRQHFFG